MRTIALFLFLLMASSIEVLSQDAADSIASPPSAITDTVSAPDNYNDLAYWIGTLASDSLGGRPNGSPHLDRAASFIATWYDSLGLSPTPDTEGFYQDYVVGNSIEGKNVVGYLEGSDSLLKNEYIVLSAHYDHVGMGIAIGGDSLYNGANDNASGVATMLGIAKRIKEGGLRPKRSLLFVAFGAEEIGLLGSRYFKDNPPVPLEKVVLNLNFEMTGHSLKLGKRNCYITGAKYSDLKDYIASSFTDENWALVDNPFPYANLFYRSDNVNLAKVRQEGEVTFGVPAHTVCTWGGEDHYHKPHDEAEFIDYENLRSLIDAMTKVTLELSNSDTRVQWVDDNFQFLE